MSEHQGTFDDNAPPGVTINIDGAGYTILGAAEAQFSAGDAQTRDLTYTLHAPAGSSHATGAEAVEAVSKSGFCPRPFRKSPVRTEVRRYSLLMELKLRKNDHKGGWQEMAPPELLALLKREVAELEEAIQHGDPLDIAQEAADIGNFAMMIADVTEGI